MGYLLFVRSCADLDRACREVSEFLSFQSRQPSSGTQVLHGIWVEPNTLSRIPTTLVPPERTWDQGLSIRQSFGVSGIWELARLHAPAQWADVQGFPDLIIDCLRGLGEEPTGLFAPVLSSGASPGAVGAELARLQSRYPGILGTPFVQDPHTGALERYG